jgi:hypothetical protein
MTACVQIFRRRDDNAIDALGRLKSAKAHRPTRLPHLAQAVFVAILGMGPPWLLTAKAAVAADMF